MRQPSVLSKLLSSVFKRKAKGPRAYTAADVVQQLRIGFPQISIPPASIHWKHTPHLRQLVNLPGSSLSGPDQADKAEAHQLLKDIVQEEVELIDSYDLRVLHGLNHNQPELYQHSNWEGLAKAQVCRRIRIISMRDFNRTLDKLIPGQQRLPLLATAWAPEQYYWAGTQNTCELACALVYARMRGLPLEYPVQLHRISLNRAALGRLHQQYRMLAIPEPAWNDADFMQFLVRYKTPYARLSFHFGEQQLEALLLPRKHELANTLGSGLSQAGACNLIDVLTKLAIEQS